MTAENLTPVRAELDLNGRRLSYLDFGGTGQPLLALHGHLDQGLMWSGLAAALAPGWRVIAPDQRGHGDSTGPRTTPATATSRIWPPCSGS